MQISPADDVSISPMTAFRLFGFTWGSLGFPSRTISTYDEVCLQAFKEQVQNSISQGIDPSNGRQNDFQGCEPNGGGDAYGGGAGTVTGTGKVRGRQGVLDRMLGTFGAEKGKGDETKRKSKKVGVERKNVWRSHQITWNGSDTSANGASDNFFTTWRGCQSGTPDAVEDSFNREVSKFLRLIKETSPCLGDVSGASPTSPCLADVSGAAPSPP